ncbi:hypothetical protein G7Y89_g14751 [Cudoniella acicularis]|uniref:Uncharacterized protein n=1 Tax=Cudoniella acicularis TaxID=354080 RepID=A0A8H4QYE9_9HELO|nr:hypothetical protein G7Y89_g14751 [Cudoniella acicularis]
MRINNLAAAAMFLTSLIVSDARVIPGPNFDSVEQHHTATATTMQPSKPLSARIVAFIVPPLEFPIETFMKRITTPPPTPTSTPTNSNSNPTPTPSKSKYNPSVAVKALLIICAAVLGTALLFLYLSFTLSALFPAWYAKHHKFTKWLYFVDPKKLSSPKEENKDEETGNQIRVQNTWERMNRDVPGVRRPEQVYHPRVKVLRNEYRLSRSSMDIISLGKRPDGGGGDGGGSSGSSGGNVEV